MNNEAKVKTLLMTHGVMEYCVTSRRDKDGFYLVLVYNRLIYGGHDEFEALGYRVKHIIEPEYC